MTQPTSERQSQEQENLVKGNHIGGDLTFSPVQNIIETQIIQSSLETITQRGLNKNSPYQGLKRFNVKDRDRFFGRDKFINRLFEAVNRSNISLVLGASGSGKSSVVRAGLIPELKNSLESQTFYDFIFTPDLDPFESLYRCLLSEEKDYNFSKSEAEIVLEAKEDTLSKAIVSLKQDTERWLIFIDQFEELFTICKDPEKQKNFVAGLVRVAKSKNSSVKIVIAMRSDFLEQLSSYPDLGRVANQNNIHLVTEMYPDELRQAIEQPAAKHGVVFEKGLIEKIIEEVEGQKGYLPLLQYTLNLLWESECQTFGNNGLAQIEDRTLHQKSYAMLEGIRGALQQRVNKIYHDLDRDEQTNTKQIFLKLVKIVETDSVRKAVSRRAYREEFVGESIQKTLNKFVDENLLVSSGEYSSQEKLQVSDLSSLKQSATVEIAHEILLSSWSELKGWLEQEKEVIILKNWLADEAKRWQIIYSEDETKSQNELLEGSRLAQIVEFIKKDAFKNVGGLSKYEEEFINVSIEWDDRQLAYEKRQKRTERILLTSTMMTVAVVIAILGSVFYNIYHSLQQRSNVIFASPGQLIRGHTRYRLTYNQALMDGWSRTSPETINQIVLGIPGEDNSTDCIDIGIVQNEKKKGDDNGEHNISLNAPKQPGVYYIHFANELQYDCNYSSRHVNAKRKRQQMWREQGQSKLELEASMIGVVIVGNWLDNIVHFLDVRQAFNKNLPPSLTRSNPEDIGTIYVSLNDFSLQHDRNNLTSLTP